MAEFPEETQAVSSDAIKDLMRHVEASFQQFKLNCKHRISVGCDHKNYHGDFALANICKLENCPVMEED